MTELVGILNITPDSFSDGGKFNHIDAAINQCHQMINEGANIIDIGAESTRPNATPLTAEQEWLRLKEILPQIRNSCPNITISLDSYHLENIIKALEININWINFVSSDIDTRFIKITQKYPNSKIVLMHNLGIPASKNEILPTNSDPIEIITQWFSEKIAQLSDKIDTNRLILDPGIGFGKNADQSLEIINNAEKFHIHQLPLLIGHSRKSFLKLPPTSNNEEKDTQTAHYSQILAKKKITYLRVHNIAINYAAVNDDTI